MVVERNESGRWKNAGLYCPVLLWVLLASHGAVARSEGLAAGGAQQPIAAAQTSPSAQNGSSTVPWHNDLAQAQAASLISHRPVLIVFTATWSEASTKLLKATLVAPESAALLTACFEPVRVDVDADPSLTRSMGVSNIPAVCVVDANGRVLTRFDCPDEPAAFVAAAGRAVQEAALARTTEGLPLARAPREQSDFAQQPSQAPPVSAAGAAVPDPIPPAPAVAAAPAVARAPTGGSAVASAPRFASAPSVAPAPAADLIADTDPALPAAPPAWPAESSAKPATWESPQASPAAGVPAAAIASESQRQILEPRPANGAAPWLNGGSQQAAAAAQATAPQVTATQATETETTPAKKTATSSFFAALQKPFSIFSKPKEPAAAKQPAPGASAGESVRAATAAAAAVPDPYGSMPLGLEGYCPVTLVDKGAWAEGRAQWGARHRGRTYLFASAEQQKAFLADPDRYAPALSGDDPVLACDTGKQIAGQRRYGVTYQARTYLFSSPETRTAFTANPQQYTARVLLAERAPDTSTIRR